MILDGQVALVTGGGQGIGKAIALRLAQEGADVGIVDVNEETAAETARQIESLGRRAVVVLADVSDHDQVQNAVAVVVGTFGRLDILVNNAGIEKMQPFLEITSSDWERQVAVNLSGTFYCTQAASREMAKRGYGRIVNLSSVAGLMGPIDLAPLWRREGRSFRSGPSGGKPSRPDQNICSHVSLCRQPSFAYGHESAFRFREGLGCCRFANDAAQLHRDAMMR